MSNFNLFRAFNGINVSFLIVAKLLILDLFRLFTHSCIHKRHRALHKRSRDVFLKLKSFNLTQLLADILQRKCVFIACIILFYCEIEIKECNSILTVYIL